MSLISFADSRYWELRDDLTGAATRVAASTGHQLVALPGRCCRIVNASADNVAYVRAVGSTGSATCGVCHPVVPHGEIYVKSLLEAALDTHVEVRTTASSAVVYLCPVAG